MQIVFIIHGEDVPIDYVGWMSLGTARLLAVTESHNTGRPPEEWELRDERGVRLDPNRKVGSCGFRDRERLFLSLEIGVGGRHEDQGGLTMSGPGIICKEAVDRCEAMCSEITNRPCPWNGAVANFVAPSLRPGLTGRKGRRCASGARC